MPIAASAGGPKPRVGEVVAGGRLVAVLAPREPACRPRRRPSPLRGTFIARAPGRAARRRSPRTSRRAGRRARAARRRGRAWRPAGRLRAPASAPPEAASSCRYARCTDAMLEPVTGVRRSCRPLPAAARPALSHPWAGGYSVPSGDSQSALRGRVDRPPLRVVLARRPAALRLADGDAREPGDLDLLAVEQAVLEEEGAGARLEVRVDEEVLRPDPQSTSSRRLSLPGLDLVAARAAGDVVELRAADELVAPRAAREQILAAGLRLVVGRVAPEAVVAGAAVERVVAELAEPSSLPEPPRNSSSPGPPLNSVVAGAADPRERDADVLLDGDRVGRVARVDRDRVDAGADRRSARSGRRRGRTPARRWVDQVKPAGESADRSAVTRSRGMTSPGRPESVVTAGAVGEAARCWPGRRPEARAWRPATKAMTESESRSSDP